MFRVVAPGLDYCLCKLSWKLVQNWLRNPRNSFTLVHEFNVNLTIEKLPPDGRTLWFCYAIGQVHTSTGLGGFEFIYNVDLVIFQNLAKIIFIIALLKKNENSRIPNFVKKSQKFEHARMTRSTRSVIFLNCGDYPSVITPGFWLYGYWSHDSDFGKLWTDRRLTSHLIFDRMS